MAQLSEVKPGDLITADLMNQILAEIQNLEVRVAKLEIPLSDQTPVIFEPQSGERLEIGQRVLVKGLNFGYTIGKHRVTFDEEPVSGYEAGSSDTLLVVYVPPLKDLTQERPVILKVSNGIYSATRTVNVAPATQPLNGTIDIAEGLPEPYPVASGGNAYFPFALSPRGLTRSANFLVSVKLTGALAGNPRIGILGPDKKTPLPGQKVPIVPEQPTTIYVSIQIPSTGVSGTTFSIALSVSAENVKGSSQVKSYTVDQANDPRDETIKLTIGNPSNPGAVVDGTIQLKTGDDVEIPITIFSSKSGSFRYDVTLSIVPKQTGSQPAINWNFLLYDPTPSNSSNPGIGKTPSFSGSKDIRFGIAPDVGASTEGRLQIKIQREGEALFQTLELDLKLLP